ncbi:hypothetical protein ABIE59_003996 [Marinobacter sp. MBR-99]|jgi:hypothetical protein
MKFIGALTCALILAVAGYFWFSETPPGDFQPSCPNDRV